MVFDHRPTVRGPRTAPHHQSRRLAGTFPYGGEGDIAHRDEPHVPELSPRPLPLHAVATRGRLTPMGRRQPRVRPASCVLRGLVMHRLVSQAQPP